MLERYGHGGDWAAAADRFGLKPESFLDFSANINPLGPPEGLKELLSHEWSRLVHYPDPDSKELRGAISSKYDIAPDSILVGNGAAEIIDLLVRYLAPRRAAVVDPAFSEYAEINE